MLTLSQGTRAARLRPAGAVPRPFIRDLIHGDLNRAFGASGFLSYDLRLTDTVRMAAILGHNIASDKVIKLQGGPVPQDYAVTFDGTVNGRIRVTRTATLEPAEFSVIMWASWTNGDSGRYMFGKAVTAGNGESAAVTLRSGTAGTIVGRVADSGGTKTATSVTENLNDGVWRRIGLSLNAAGQFRIRIGGVVDITTTGVGTPLYNTALDWFFGLFDLTLGGGRWIGDQDEICIYNRDLSDAEWAADALGNYAASGLVLRLKLDEGIGGPLSIA